jgi:hypothetical protein
MNLAADVTGESLHFWNLCHGVLRDKSSPELTINIHPNMKGNFLLFPYTITVEDVEITIVQYYYHFKHLNISDMKGI